VARVSVNEVDALRSKARMLQRAKQDLVGARALALQADELLDHMDGPLDRRADVYAGMAVIWRDLGEADRCEAMIVTAIALEAEVEPARPIWLGTHKLFYADFLHRQRRFAEAVQHGTEGVAIYARGIEPDHPELAALRAIVAGFVRDARANPPS